MNILKPVLKPVAKILPPLSVFASLLFLSACGGGADAHDHSDEPASAVAVLHPTTGNSAAGIVYFNQTEDGRIRIVADITGLAPNSSHGFHIHEYGDVSAPDGTSAGGHYSPKGHLHGAPGDAEHHAGDLGNLESNPNGNARKEMTVDFLSINGMENPILGRGVIVHAGKDDLTSQPTGSAGARIAGGVIGVANPDTRP